jgi:hypothetical protein
MENDRNIPVPTMPGDSTRALFMSGLWLQLGFVGASVLAIALTRLVDGGASASLALASALGAGVLTVLAWHRSRSVLDRIDASTAAGTAGTRPAAFGQGLGPAVAR